MINFHLFYPLKTIIFHRVTSVISIHEKIPGISLHICDRICKNVYVYYVVYTSNFAHLIVHYKICLINRGMLAASIVFMSS